MGNQHPLHLLVSLDPASHPVRSAGPEGRLLCQGQVGPCHSPSAASARARGLP